MGNNNNDNVTEMFEKAFDNDNSYNSKFVKERVNDVVLWVNNDTDNRSAVIISFDNNTGALLGGVAGRKDLIKHALATSLASNTQLLSLVLDAVLDIRHSAK